MKHAMNKLAFIALSIVLACTGGCRREDIREFSVEMPVLTAADQPKVVAALAPYGGVDKSSYRWDMAKKTLTLKYDSMQIARTNIRMAIEKAGVQVVYPTNTTGRAGY